MESHLELTALLDQLENHLLALERSPQGDPSQLHAAFQKAHSLKSLLGLIGWPNASKLIHQAEEKLDALRRDSVMNESPWETLLSTVDKIRRALAQGVDVAEFETAPPDHGKPEREKASWPYALQETTVRMMAKDAASGMRFWKFEKTFRSSLTKEQWVKLPVFRTLADAGIFYHCYPDFPNWDRNAGEVVVSFLFGSHRAEEELEALFHDPIQEVTHPKPPPSALLPTGTSRLRVLIAEDERFSLELLRRSLEGMADVATAEDGQRAWVAFETAQEAGKPFHLVILDQMMPRMSGQTVLKKIREWEENHGFHKDRSCKIYINTAVDSVAEAQQAFRDQADGYFVKPFSMDKILEAVKAASNKLTSSR